MGSCPFVPCPCSDASTTVGADVPGPLPPRPGIAPTDTRVVARALRLALDPTRDESAAIEELRALAGGDLSVLSLAWMDLVEQSFRQTCSPVLQAEYLLHQAIMRQQHSAPAGTLGSSDAPYADGQGEHAPIVA